MIVIADETVSHSYSEGQPLYTNTEPEPLYCNLPDFVTSLPPAPGPPGYVTPPGPGERPPPPYKTPSPSAQPLYVNMASLASQPLYANLARTLSTPSTPTRCSKDDGLFKVPLPPKHVSTSSCPASPSVTSTSAASRPASTSTSSSSSTMMPNSNLSLDSQFLDPDELAAKGATLLHHLALWMIQQKTTSEAGTSSSSSQAGPGPSSLVTEDIGASPRLMAEAATNSSPSSSSHLHTQSLPIRRQAVQSSSFSHMYSR